MTIRAYTVTVTQVVPTEAGTFVRNEVGRLNGAFGLSYKETLNQPATLSVSFLPEAQDEAVAAAIRSPAYELNLWLLDSLVFRGPAVVRQGQASESGITFSLQARDALHYLWRRLLDPTKDHTYSDVDQFDIAASLVSLAQADPYSGFGIDASGLGLSGVTRDRTYEAAEFHVVGQRLTELATVDNGFDFWIDPGTLVLMAEYPQRGVDKTATVVIDRSSMLVPAATWVWGIEDYVSHAYGLSTGQDEAYVIGEAENPTVLTEFGRADLGATYQDVTNQETINDHARRMADERADILYLPAPQAIASGFDRSDIDVGDLVEVSYDYGLGTETVDRRIASITTTIGDDGNETFGLELV